RIRIWSCRIGARCGRAQREMGIIAARAAARQAVLRRACVLYRSPGLAYHSSCRHPRTPGENAMPRLTAQDFAPELLELYDFYAHGLIDRREFLGRASRFAAGGLSAAAVLAALSPDYALAVQVPFTDPDIHAEYITYPSPKGNGTVRAYLVRPAQADGHVPGVVVVHENRGLNPYIEDVARRLAKAGFMALAPDGLSAKGGYPGNDDQGRELQRQLDPVKL